MLLDLAIVVAIAFCASVLVCRAIIAAGPRDAPDGERKLHPTVTPTSGGVGIGVGFAAAVIVLSLYSSVWRFEVHPRGLELLWLSALFAYPLLVIGFVDDSRGLGPAFKFIVYAGLALAAVALIGPVRSLGGAELPYLLALGGTALWVFTTINIVNFMDGANGLSLGCVAIGLIVLALIALDGGTFSAAAMALCGAGAIAGFLIWNFPGGRLFAGDSGALFAGALAAFASLVFIHRASASAFVAPLLFFPLFADGLLTLLYRVRRGRKLLVGHTEHLYQIAISAGWSHSRVTLAYWAATGACAAIAGLAVRGASDQLPTVVFVGFAAASIVVDTVVRGWAERRGLLKG